MLGFAKITRQHHPRESMRESSAGGLVSERCVFGIGGLFGFRDR